MGASARPSAERFTLEAAAFASSPNSNAGRRGHQPDFHRWSPSGEIPERPSAHWDVGRLQPTRSQPRPASARPTLPPEGVHAGAPSPLPSRSVRPSAIGHCTLRPRRGETPAFRPACRSPLSPGVGVWEVDDSALFSDLSTRLLCRRPLQDLLGQVEADHVDAFCSLDLFPWDDALRVSSRHFDRYLEHVVIRYRDPVDPSRIRPSQDSLRIGETIPRTSSVKVQVQPHHGTHSVPSPWRSTRRV